jgi:hypothetical protein
MDIRKRDLLTAGLGLGVGLAGLASSRSAAAQTVIPQPPPPAGVRQRRVRTTLLYKSPEGFPNGLAASPEGLWIGEQKGPDAVDKSEKAMLVDWKTGKLLRTVVTQSRNTSGMAYGDGYIWMGANADPQGFFQTDMDSRTISHRQIPLGQPDNGSGTHGAFYHEGKVWIVANRLRGILRVDAKTWQPEFMIPFRDTRWHDAAWDNGAIWMVTGTSNIIPQNQPGLAKYDAATGRLLETAVFEPGSCDPHGLEIHNGVFYTCDAGIAPGFIDSGSPTSRYICRIDFVA